MNSLPSTNSSCHDWPSASVAPRVSVFRCRIQRLTAATITSVQMVLQTKHRLKKRCMSNLSI